MEGWVSGHLLYFEIQPTAFDAIRADALGCRGIGDVFVRFFLRRTRLVEISLMR